LTGGLQIAVKSDIHTRQRQGFALEGMSVLERNPMNSKNVAKASFWNGTQWLFDRHEMADDLRMSVSGFDKFCREEGVPCHRPSMNRKYFNREKVHEIWRKRCARIRREYLQKKAMK
jgi:hypothetical protein